MKPRRVDVVVVDFPFSAGGGSKIRPALVVQSDHNNQRLANTIVAQITSRLLHLGEPTRLLVDPTTPDGQSSGLHSASAIACENLVTVHNDLNVRVIGRLSDPVMGKVDDCLRESLDL